MNAQTDDRRFRQWMIGLGVLIVLMLPLAYSAVIVPLPPREQAEASLAMIALAVVASLSRPMRPLIIFLSCFASIRYFWWRIGSTLNLSTPLDAIVCLMLLAAESYGLLILFLGYFQTIELFERKPEPLKRTPPVDIFIPTYNEGVDIVRRTLIGAMAIDYPLKKVYVLDDGRRPEIERMVKALGGLYMTRPDNAHAKAGNVNHALAHTDGEFIAIFDADHVPVRSFLRKTLGFFEDKKVALVQSAQHFFNPDPYERNLNLTGRVAPEQHFFYRVIQPGNDFWNAAFFCGSCAVLRRSALAAIGGLKTETVTEDAHTALELHARGYRSVYLSMPLAAGLATESFAAHVKQRIRWARGMAQILRIDCPLFKRGLALPQRLNYFNAMSHFFFGAPRLMLIVAPLTYLFLGAHPLKADALEVVAYILPHIGLSMIANSLISRRFRHSFWAAVYEVSIAPYVAGVTALAMVNPRLGKFNVTDKGTNQDEARFDRGNSSWTLALLALSAIGLLVAFPARLLWFAWHGGPPAELDSMVLNSVWAAGNLVVLVAAACVGYEQPQQRNAPRVRRDFACELHAGGETIPCRTVDISETGVRVALRRPVPIGPECRIVISTDFAVDVDVSARRVRYDWSHAGAPEAAFAFSDASPATLRRLVEIVFTGENSWTANEFPEDSVLRSFWYMLTTFWRTTKARNCARPQAPPLEGNWPASLGGVACECTSVSGAGALIRFLPGATLPGAGAFVIDRLQVPNARVSVVRIDKREAEVEFAWNDSTEERAFWDALYKLAPQRLARRHPVWRWIEDLA